MSRRARSLGSVRLAACLALLTLCVPVRAEDTAPSPEQAADEVLAAHASGNTDALKALAARREPDPWLVADELCARGEYDAAEALAGAATHPGCAQLAEYVVRQRKREPSTAAREALRAAQLAPGHGDPEGLLKALESVDVPGDDVVSILLSHARGQALQKLRRFEPSFDALRGAARRAEQLGWLHRAAWSWSDAASTLHDAGEYARALEVWPVALRLFEAVGDRGNVGGTLNNMGRTRAKGGDFRGAVETTGRGVAEAEAAGHKVFAARGLQNLGQFHQSLGEYDLSHEAMERALALYQDAGDSAGAARVLADLGWFALRIREDPVGAEAYLRRALALVDEVHLEELEGRVLGCLGEVAACRGDHREAFRIFECALTGEEKRGNAFRAAYWLVQSGTLHLQRQEASAAIPLLERAVEVYRTGHGSSYETNLGMTLALLGRALQDAGQTARALAYVEEAVVLLEAARDELNLAAALGTLGHVHRLRGEFGPALAAHERSRGLFQKHGLRGALAKSLGNIGSVLANMGDHAGALDHGIQALAMLDAASAPQSVMTQLLNVGIGHLELGHYAEALTFLDRASQLAEEIGLPFEQVKILGEKAVARGRLGEAAEAFGLLDRAADRVRVLEDPASAAAALSLLADDATKIGAYAQAEAHLVAALELSELRNDRAAVAGHLIQLGHCRVLVGAYEDAVSAFRRAVELAEEVDANHERARALSNLGLTLADMGRHEEGRKTTEEARSLFAAMGSRGGEANAVFNLAVGRFRGGRYREARRLADESHRLLAALDDRAGVAGAVEMLAGIDDAELERERALDGYRRALALREALGVPDGISNVCSSMAGTLATLGRFREAVAYQERAEAAAKRSGRPLLVAHALRSRGAVQFQQGRWAECLASDEQAREIYARIGAQGEVVEAEVHAAHTLVHLGRYSEALLQLDRVQETARSIGLTLERAHALRVLAFCHNNLKNPDRALVVLQEARSAYGVLNHAWGLAEMRLSIAKVLRQQGRLEEALTELEGTLADDHGLEPRTRARALSNVGDLLVDLDRDGDAEPYLLEALRMARALGAGRTAECARVSLARIHEGRGELREALEICEDVERDARSRNDLCAARGDAFEVARLRFNLGEFRAATAGAEETLRGEFVAVQGLGEEEAFGMRPATRARADLGVLACLALQAEEPEDASTWSAKAHWFVEAGRALLLADRLVNRAAFLEGRVPAEVLAARTSAWVEVRDLSRRLVGLGKQCDADSEVLARVAARLGECYARHADAVARIQREAHRVADVVYPEPVDLATAQSSLRGGEALVLYQLARGKALALIVRRDGVALRDLGEETDLVVDAESLVRVLSVPSGDDRTLATLLYDRLLRPLEADLAGVERILVSPDGVLTFVPFETLLRADGERRERAIERWEFAYVPSGTVLASLLDDAKRRGQGDGLVALGDPVYPGESRPVEGPVTTVASREAELRGLASLDRLLHSGEEVRAAGKLFPEEKRTLLLREAATLEGLRAALDGVEGRLRVLHLGCHGHVDTERPRLTGLVLGGGEVLTLDDVYRLTVPADLVVLSACESGKGKLVRGEGVMGLVRGFFFAGAPRVVVSNWKVNDASTKALMVSFYRHLIGEGKHPGAALREAKLEMLRAGGSRAHPFHWAPFVLWGLAE